MYIVNVTFADGYTAPHLINNPNSLIDFALFHCNSARFRNKALPIFCKIADMFDNPNMWVHLKQLKVKDVFHVQCGEPVRIYLRTKNGKNKRMCTPFLTIDTILEHYENRCFSKCDNDIEYLNSL